MKMGTRAKLRRILVFYVPAISELLVGSCNCLCIVWIYVPPGSINCAAKRIF